MLHLPRLPPSPSTMPAAQRPAPVPQEGPPRLFQRCPTAPATVGLPPRSAREAWAGHLQEGARSPCLGASCEFSAASKPEKPTMVTHKLVLPVSGEPAFQSPQLDKSLTATSKSTSLDWSDEIPSCSSQESAETRIYAVDFEASGDETHLSKALFERAIQDPEMNDTARSARGDAVKHSYTGSENSECTGCTSPEYRSAIVDSPHAEAANGEAMWHCSSQATSGTALDLRSVEVTSGIDFVSRNVEVAIGTALESRSTAASKMPTEEASEGVEIPLDLEWRGGKGLQCQVELPLADVGSSASKVCAQNGAVEIRLEPATPRTNDDINDCDCGPPSEPAANGLHSDTVTILVPEGVREDRLTRFIYAGEVWVVEVPEGTSAGDQVTVSLERGPLLYVRALQALKSGEPFCLAGVHGDERPRDRRHVWAPAFDPIHEGEAAAG